MVIYSTISLKIFRLGNFRTPNGRFGFFRFIFDIIEAVVALRSDFFRESDSDFVPVI